MGFETLALISLGLGAVQTIVGNQALDDANDAAVAQADAEIAELNRQREERTEIAQEEKADRVREADQQFASMVVALADNGGAGTQNESRFALEIGGNEGIDLARIEANRVRDNESLKASQLASRNRALNTVAANRGKQKANSIKFLSSAVGTGLKIQGHREVIKATKNRKT